MKGAADVNGVRPSTRISYDTFYARYKINSNTISTSPTGLNLVTQVSRCRTGEAPACVGTADEALEITTYPSDTVAHNLQPIAVTRKAGDNTLEATTAYTYDIRGRLVAVDGPQAGPGDSAKIAYNASGQVIARIGVDPDGSGPSPFPAEKIQYDTSGRVSVRETGYTYSPYDTALTAFVPKVRLEYTYNTASWLTSVLQKQIGGNTKYSLTHYSYDSAGRSLCVNSRMSMTASYFASDDICKKKTASTYGEDRISQTIYDAVDRVIEQRSGVDTSLLQTTQKLSYNANGTVAWVEDAKGNRTGFEYDGFDRRTKTIYPSSTTANTTNASDYQQATFDAAGNILSVRSRAGETFDLAYDDLNRVTSKIVPERSGLASTFTRDVYYAYDLYGALTSARFDSATGEGITLSYNGLGQPTGATSNLDGVSRSLGYGYDAVGNLSSLTFPDSQAFSYTYDIANRPTGIKDPAANQLVTFDYDPASRLKQIGRPGTAHKQNFAYDVAGRLASYAIANGSSSQDVTWLMGYNPAGQIAISQRNTDAYAWPGHVNTDRNYTANGLNQYSQVASTSFVYDANGNLTSDGSTTFTYDPENRLVKTTGGSSVELRYDPLGRLYEVKNTATSDITRFLYDGSDLVAEYNGAGVLQKRYIHGLGGGDDPLVQYNGSTVSMSNLRHLYPDLRGSIVLSTDKDGANTQINSYDEYGIPGSGNQGRFQYTGQAWIAELGMYHYKARMYSPTLGRFLQTDPIGYADGMNMYAYVGNDPINNVDPTGLQMIDVTAHARCTRGRWDPGCDPWYDGPYRGGYGPPSAGYGGTLPPPAPPPPENYGPEIVVVGPEAPEEEIVVSKKAPPRIPSLYGIYFDATAGLEAPQSGKGQGLFCKLVSKIPSNGRLRLGADGAGGAGLFGRGGIGVSVDNKGNIYLDDYIGVGVGKGLSAAVGVSYVANPPQYSQVSGTVQGDLGVGWLGGQAQAGVGSRSGFGTSHTLTAAPVGTRVGAAVSATANLEGVAQIYGGGC